MRSPQRPSHTWNLFRASAESRLSCLLRGPGGAAGSGPAPFRRWHKQRPPKRRGIPPALPVCCEWTYRQCGGTPATAISSPAAFPVSAVVFQLVSNMSLLSFLFPDRTAGGIFLGRERGRGKQLVPGSGRTLHARSDRGSPCRFTAAVIHRAKILRRHANRSIPAGDFSADAQFIKKTGFPRSGFRH